MAILLREIFGTVLILAGLTIAGFCVWFLHEGYVIEGGALVLLTLIVLGAGAHLLKVALAVRVLQESRK